MSRYQVHDREPDGQRLTEKEAEQQINARSPIPVRSTTKEAWGMELIINIHYETIVTQNERSSVENAFSNWYHMGEIGRSPPGYFLTIYDYKFSENVLRVNVNIEHSDVVSALVKLCNILNIVKYVSFMEIVIGNEADWPSEKILA